MQKILERIRASFLTIPRPQDWLDTVGLLILFTVIYVPIGFQLGFLKIEIQHSWLTILGVTFSALLMPGLFEEFLFRALLIPHPTEAMPLKKRWFYIGLSWVLFVLYHLHPLVPQFFRTPGFLIGAGLIGIICTLSYVKSGSIWLAVILHWLIVAVWLLVFGGLKRFSG